LVLLATSLLAACSWSLPDGWLYTTRVTAEGATVVWTGDAERVVCHDRGGRRVAAEAKDVDGLRRARLEGLKAGEEYRCRVGERRVRFRTAPPPGTPWRFAVVGDSGDGSRKARALPAVIAAARPDLLVHVGDLAYPHGSAEELDGRFFAPYRELLERVPLLTVPGNHDLVEKSDYRQVFGPVADVDDEAGPRSVVDWPSARLVAFASTAILRDLAGPTWLGTALATAPAGGWRIVVMHEPLYAPPEPKWVTRGLRDVVGPTLEAAGVDLALSGHQHLYARSEPSCEWLPTARVLHVISGGGGANLDVATGDHPGFPVVRSATEFVVVDVAPDALDIRGIDLIGNEIDRVRLTRDGPPPRCRADGWPPAREADR
jgi:hypothetical protein